MTEIATAIAALTPPAAEGEVTQAAFTEGLWAGWRSGLAGEQMDDGYAARSWLASDANSRLSHSAPKDMPEGWKSALQEISKGGALSSHDCKRIALEALSVGPSL